MFYGEHQGKFFYNRLVTYMSSGTCQPLILYRPDAIQHWRQLMGPTKVFSTRYTWILCHKIKFFPSSNKSFHSKIAAFKRNTKKSFHIPLLFKGSILTLIIDTRYTHPDSIRGQFGVTDTRNSSHGSDSDQSAQQEINFFFPEFDMNHWRDNESKIFEEGSVEFNKEKFIHEAL